MAKQIKRIEGLDWLRGAMALSIMFYHYVSWEIADLPINTILGKLGIYAVSIFFVLSGLSLAIVYSGYIKSTKKAIFFFIRRIFRIWPVLWVTVVFFVLLAAYNHETVDSYLVVMNLTTLFGFFDFSRYVSPGVWSIGNEMVYYTITPFAIMVYNQKRLYGNILFAVALAIGMAFSFYLIDSQSTLAKEWKDYINPFNNLFFFISGIALYYNFRDIRSKRITIIASLAVIFLLFAYIDVKGDAIGIVTGINRIIFSALSIVAVFLFWKIDYTLPMLIRKPLANICLATYPIYLLHPLVLESVKTFVKIDIVKNPFFLISFSAIITIAVSMAIYKFIEKPFINFGKKLTVSKAAVVAKPVFCPSIIAK